MSEMIKTAALVSAEYDADIIIYFGPISRNWDDMVIDFCREKPHKKTNVILLLTTLGGDPHAAYRIARCLQHHYHKKGAKGEVIIFVNSICASAGTLITLAADKLILSDHAELGPLDAQIRKPDEVGERTSGLTPIQALDFLELESRKFFKAQFEGLRFNRSLTFSTKMAADISAQLASGLLARLYDQIDPLRLAEYDRMMRIAEHYGDRIKTNNVKPHAIQKLLKEYPSHEFCIDLVEAKELFNNVDVPSESLSKLGNLLKPHASKYLNSEDSVSFYLQTEEDKPKESSDEKPKPKPKKRADKRPASVPHNGKQEKASLQTASHRNG